MIAKQTGQTLNQVGFAYTAVAFEQAAVVDALEEVEGREVKYVFF